MTDAPLLSTPLLTTRVGHASIGYYRFRGYNVSSQLVGSDGYWSAVSLALGSTRLDAEQSSVFDELSTALLGPDPRIWPWKLCRLMSAYGRVTTGIAGPLIAMTGGRVGPSALAAAARFICELNEEIVSNVDDDHALAFAIDKRLATDPRPAGFGVPFRAEDERVALIASIVERHGRTVGHYWKLIHRIASLVVARKKLPLNAAGAVAAVLLDLGFSPRQIDVFGVLLVLTNMVANAFEGAEQAPEVLRELPDHCVRYAGPSPRVSPRAAGALVG